MSTTRTELGFAGGLFYGLGKLLGAPLIVRRSFLHIHAVDCSRGELAEICAVGARDLDLLAHVMLRLTGCVRYPDPISLYCFGSRAAADKISAVLPHFADGTLLQGAWSGECKLGALRLSDNMSVRRAIVHEATHALLDILTDGFAYPLSVSEGYAALMEHTIIGGAESAGTNQRARQRSSDGECPTGACSSVQSLLEDPDIRTVTASSYESFARHSFWLIGYLGSRNADAVRRMLRELREASGGGSAPAYKWLLAAVGLSSDLFERGYRSYHTETVTGE